MDIRIFVLLVFVGVLGSLAQAEAGFIRYPRNGEVRRDVPPLMQYSASRSKREVGDSNGETANSSETTTQSTTTPTTTTTSTTEPTTTDPTTTDPTTKDPTTTDPTTTDPTSPSTTPSTEPTTTPTTEATTPTTPTTSPTTPSTTPTTPATSPTTPTTTPTTAGTTPGSTTPESTKPTKKPTDDILSRSNFDEPESEDSPKKPGPSSTGDAAPTPGPYYGPGAFGPYFGPGFGSGFDPYFGYPGPNFIPGSGQNYGWPSASSGSGFAGASAGAGSFAGGYSGMGYPTAGFPTMGSTNIGSRGGFQDNSPDQTGYNPRGIDPLYNAGSGFYFPGQYPSYNDPFDMFKQIQAQIDAQHQASANSMASHHFLMANQRRAWNTPNHSYPYASGNVNNIGRHPTFGGSFNPGVGNSNMEFHNRLASEAANYGGTPQVASASIGLGPNGGFQTGQISPALPGIESRFAEDLPAPSGNSFGVFASSSSSSRTGPDGKQINHKSSITGVNDNGKVSYRTVHD